MSFMTTFNETDHPRNHPSNAGRFSEKPNSAPEEALAEHPSEFTEKRARLAEFLFDLAGCDGPFESASDAEVANYTADADDVLRANPHLLTLRENERLAGEEATEPPTPDLRTRQLIDDILDKRYARFDPERDGNFADGLETQIQDGKVGYDDIRALIEEGVLSAQAEVPAPVPTYVHSPEEVAEDVVWRLWLGSGKSDSQKMLFDRKSFTSWLTTAIKNDRRVLADPEARL
jgi:hypothetical protein